MLSVVSLCSKDGARNIESLSNATMDKPESSILYIRHCGSLTLGLGCALYSIQTVVHKACRLLFPSLRKFLMPLQAPSLPAPPFSILLGSIKAMAEMYAHAPTDCHPHGVFAMMQRKYNLKGMWFMDSWPASPQRQLVIAEPVCRPLS